MKQPVNGWLPQPPHWKAYKMILPPQLGPEFMNIVKPVWDTDQPDHIKLSLMWNMLTGLQGVMLGQLLISRIGTRVFAGPFRGMQLTKDALRWNFTPALLGTYEWEAHGVVEEIIAKRYKNILNIGCGYGYYAVGLALRMPEAKIHAYESDAALREQCRMMAELNEVSDRITIAEAFEGTEYERFSRDETCVVMDVEGAEKDLLNPARYPALTRMDVLVQLYDFLAPNISTALPLLFASTHNVRVFPNAPFSFPLEKILGPDYLPGHFDNLIATWENRGGTTPFGAFTRK